MTGTGACAMTLSMKMQRWQGSVPPDPAALRGVLEAEVYSVYAWTDDRGATYPPHTHGDDQSHWVVRGAIALAVGGEEYVVVTKNGCGQDHAALE
jgi:quercetin dioxygenase-like cupin family protein